LGVKERKEREKEIRRDEIMKTGEKLFIEKGFNNATMDAIAAACELAKGTLYLHFKSKEELLSAIMHKSLTVLYDLMIKHQAGIDNPIERLRALGDAHLEFYKQNPEYFRLVSEVHMPGKFHPDINDKMHILLHERIKSIWDINMGIIRDGKEMGIFKESADPLEVAISLWAISTVMINVYDFRNYILEKNKNGNWGMPIVEFDFLNAIGINARRIIFSILKNPPADFDLMK